MIILEQPYVSEFLQQTVAELQVPVLKTPFSSGLEHSGRMNLIGAEAFFTALSSSENPLLYSNSENSAELLNKYAPELRMTRNVNFFKDKSNLREAFSALNPEVWYRTCSLEELGEMDITSLDKPFVVKPVRGFASIGIHAIRRDADWQPALEAIRKEVLQMRDVFPDAVVSLDSFLLEKYIEGPEIAIDAYFNAAGEPVVLNILEHLFSSPSDMSDRLYLTSAEIVRNRLGKIDGYLREVGRLRDLRNFPFHLEMRVDGEGRFVPIEINPMRFMGFCVADVEYYFYGINPYECYFRQQKPDWEEILRSREDKLYGMFGIDIPKHLDKTRIRFDYDAFIGRFTKPLFHVKMDYTRFPMAIYLFAETTPDRFGEFEEILHSDLSEFIFPE